MLPSTTMRARVPQYQHMGNRRKARRCRGCGRRMVRLEDTTRWRQPSTGNSFVVPVEVYACASCRTDSDPGFLRRMVARVASAGTKKYPPLRDPGPRESRPSAEASV